jgi:hypothetical protein
VTATEDDGGLASVSAAIRSSCDDVSTELTCYTSFPNEPKVFDNLELGYYFIIVHRSSFNQDAFDVNITVQSLVTECNDGVDNDADDLIDVADPGCSNGFDDTEGTDAEPDFVSPACSDGIDNDEDGDTDYPDDLFCARAGANNEAPFCLNYDGEIIVVSESTGDNPLVIDTTASTNNYQRSESANGNDVPFVLLITEPSNVSITYDSGFDTYLHMRESDCDSPEVFAYNDDSVGLNSSISLDNLAPGIYYVFADGFGNSSNGVITVTVTIDPLIP